EAHHLLHPQAARRPVAPATAATATAATRTTGTAPAAAGAAATATAGVGHEQRLQRDLLALAADGERQRVAGSFLDQAVRAEAGRRPHRVVADVRDDVAFLQPRGGRRRAGLYFFDDEPALAVALDRRAEVAGVPGRAGQGRFDHHDDGLIGGAVVGQVDRRV